MAREAALSCSFVDELGALGNEVRAKVDGAERALTEQTEDWRKAWAEAINLIGDYNFALQLNPNEDEKGLGWVSVVETFGAKRVAL